MVISDVWDGEGVERLSVGEDRRTVCSVGQSDPICHGDDSLTKSP